MQTKTTIYQFEEMSKKIEAEMRYKFMRETAKIYKKSFEKLNGYTFFLINSNFHFPFSSEEVFGEINLGNTPLPKIKTITPYPDKEVRLISAVNGGRFTNIGIPLIFENYEQLETITNLTVTWRHKDFFALREGENAQEAYDETNPILAKLNFKLRFEKEPSKEGDIVQIYLLKFQTVYEICSGKNRLTENFEAIIKPYWRPSSLLFV